MSKWFKDLDALLRGKRTTTESIDPEMGYALPIRVFLPLLIGLGASYGFFMGWYRIALHWESDTSDGLKQTLASMIKLPALFLLTLVVTFPSLYVFNALLGSHLRFWPLLRLIIAALCVSMAVAASFGPILAFFTLSTTNYQFMVALNVILLAISGFVGLGFLLKALRQLGQASVTLQPPPQGEVENTAQFVARQKQEDTSSSIFAVWVLIYGAVGVQMAWLLRPFIGHPNDVFTWFRPRVGNFLSGFVENLQRLIGQ